MSASITGDTQEEIDIKKRKLVEEVETSKIHITDHFHLQPKMTKSPSALKKSSYATNTVPDVDMDLTDPLYTALSTTCLHLVLDFPPDQDYVGRCRLNLSRLFSAMTSADPNVAMLPYSSKPERAACKVHSNRNACDDQLSKLSKSITQIQKYFLEGKLKRGGGTVFTNF